jgi:hypothetical protein
MSEDKQAQFNGWARVEVMGHQSHIGFVRTEAYGQAVLFRIDTPELPEREFVLEEPAYVDGRWTPEGAKVRRAASDGVSVLVGAGSIYRIVPCTEEAALKAIESAVRAELKLVSVPPDKALPEPQSRNFKCCAGNPEDGHEPGCPNEFEDTDQSAGGAL